MMQLLVEIFNGKIRDNHDEWIYAFKNGEVKDEFNAPGIKEMGEKLDFVSMAPEKQKARKEGIEQRNIEIAQQMKSEGLDPDLISRMTGLSAEKIEKLN